jgi:pSer/pThr/pTyr-binding forkhead associated (FHA) protein
MATYQIVMSKGPNPGKIYNLSSSSITIGRDFNSDIVLNIPEVSRRHAQFRTEGGVYYLEDLGSTNGTFVNGQRLETPHRMYDGETIMLGEAVTFNYRVVGPPDPNATIIGSSSQDATMVAGDQSDYESFAPGGTYKIDDFEAPPPMHEPIEYSEQYQQDAVPDYSASYEKAESPNRTWLFAGLGCIFILILGCVAAAILFDTMDMYCQPPFDTLFSFLYTCP